jgi:signal transduction histidine kinase
MFFFVNSLLIAVFFAVSIKESVEWFYPFLISTFLIGLFLIIRWFQYYPFNSRLTKNGTDANYDLSPSSCEQHLVGSVIEKIHHSYLEQIVRVQSAHKNNRHFFTQWIHNMKTPVSVIDLVIQRIQRTDISLDAAVFDIQDENARLADHLDEALSILRLEDFSRDYIPESVDLAQAVKNVINSRKNQFVYNHVFPRLEFVEGPVCVLSDTKWNEVILDQIISNAIKYSASENESKSIYFKIEKQPDHVLLKIRDEGIGIPEYDIPRLFEAFFTGENGRKHKNATGIGLYICKLVAEKLGHHICLQSRVGQGTEVTVTYLTKS